MKFVPLQILTIVLLLSFPLSGQSPMPRIQGTFLQLSEDRAYMAPDQLQRVFEHCRYLGIKEIVVQWTVLNGIAFYPSAVHPGVKDRVLNRLIELASKFEIDLYIGLVHDRSYWAKIQKSPELTEQFLRRYRSRSKATANELIELLKDSSVFKGWYLPEEIDDVNWLEPGKRKVLFVHLTGLVQFLQEITPGKAVAISGFANGFADPELAGQFWSELVSETGIGTVFFQDGIGAGKLDTFSAPLYFAELQRALRNRARLIPVVELFEQIEQTGSTFNARPADLDRIYSQLQIAQRFSSEPVYAFSTFDYMSSFAGEEAQSLATRYLRQISQGLPR